MGQQSKVTIDQRREDCYLQPLFLCLPILKAVRLQYRYTGHVKKRGGKSNQTTEQETRTLVSIPEIQNQCKKEE